MRWKIVEVLVPLASLCLSATAQTFVKGEEAALIIGGFYPDEDGTNIVTNSVELFGCYYDYSIPLPDYPEELYLPAATYVASEGRVLSCGGFTCEGGSISSGNCELKGECHYWSETTGEWDEDGQPSPMALPKFNFFMAQAININNTEDADNPEVPLALGSGYETEIFDPENSQWIEYLLLEDNRWFGLGCLVQNDDMIYFVRNEVVTLNLTTWEFEELSVVPDALVLPQRCAFVTIDGSPGIFTRFGYFYDIASGEWQKKAVPPYDGVSGLANAMFTFQGKPTVFGSPVCGSEGSCKFQDIIQYDSSVDEWMKIGEMLESRELHEVVVLPSSICNNFVSGFSSTVSPPTEDPDDSEQAQGQSSLGQRAALVVGGSKSNSDPSSVVQTVELFGCPSSPQNSIYVTDIPESIYLTGGILMPEEDRVLVCGGFACDELLNCGSSDSCYFWSPSTDTWTEAPTLPSSRNNFIIALAPNVNVQDGETQLPLIVGNSLNTWILSEDGSTWEDYEDVPIIWYGDDCFFQHDGFIYSLKADVYELNPYTWTYEVLAEVPTELVNRGRCAPVEIDGELGILLVDGDFFSLRSLTWKKFSSPPLDPIGDGTNEKVMDTFNNRPSIFGAPVCDDQGVCENRQVIQYDPENDAWVVIGNLRESRILPEIIDVPIEFCDYFAAEETANVQNEIALIIGGYYDNDAQWLSSVDLFGCDGKESVMLDESYPLGSALLPAAKYLANEGRVMSCGGRTCDAPPCLNTNNCYYWYPVTGGWEEAPPMTEEKFDIFMATMPNILNGDLNYSPGILGYSVNSTEIFNPTNNKWEGYIDLESDRWAANECLFQEGSKIYHIGSQVEVLDLDDWTVQYIADAPDNLVFPRKCAYVEIDGDPGIFTRFGYFFNLNTESWEKRAYPPYEPLADVPNAMYTFRGRPTVFGTSDCNQEGFCLHNKIVQYQQETDEWVEIGEMAQSRTFHTVVNVPGSYCQDLVGESNRNTAALVIGGYLLVNNGQGVESIQSVELFGCDGSSADSIRVKDYPNNIYLHAGKYFDELGKVMVCGGITCSEGGQCAPQDVCYYWNPEIGGAWEPAPSLTTQRFNFILPEVTDINDPSAPPSLVTVGSSFSTDIFDLEVEEWGLYEDIPSQTFLHLGCTVEYNGLIYSFRTEIIAIDPTTWSIIDNFPPVPEAFQTGIGRCSGLEINGEPGIFLRFGYWFGLESEQWVKLAVPPNDPTTTDVNAMWTFRGRPTVFGAARCDDLGNCDLKDVLQYNPDLDTWELIGRMKDDRRTHEVVEIPGEMCDYFDLGQETLSYIKPPEISSTTSSLKIQPASSEGIRDEVAMIIGGYFADSASPVLRSVELFGCSGTETISLEQYPVEEGYLMGATYWEEEGLVMSCGGYTCVGASTDCEAREDCHWWSPVTGAWGSAPDLVYPKYNFLMATIPNIDVSLTDVTPAALGQGNTTEIFDKVADEWLPYLDLPVNEWLALDCLIQVGDSIYSVGDRVEVLDVLEWRFQTIGDDVPFGINQQGRCAYIEINGNAGIFTRYGYFFDLITETWSKAVIPPYDAVNPDGMTNSLWSFEGKPTIFGDATCDDEAVCELKNIVQYDANDDVWTVIGAMSESRGFHEIVMMPKEICTNFVDPPATTTTPSEDETVALIIGGTQAYGSQDLSYQSVEVFGCPNYGAATSIRLRDFPYPVYFSAGMYRDDVDKVMVCGGQGCVENVCIGRTACYLWPSDRNDWFEAPEMLDDHVDTLLVYAPNLKKADQPMEPLIIGNGFATEILDTETDTWTEYSTVSDRNWYATRCFVELDGKIYSLRSRVQVLDLATWTLEDQEDLPEGLVRRGRCSATYIDGQPGIFLPEGYWYSINDKTWAKKASPPLDPTTDLPNSMWTFRGKPTIFGNNVCDANANCEQKGILQYDPETDAWEDIGRMLVSRKDHEVVEMPASFCYQLIQEEETTTTTAEPTETPTTKTTKTTTDTDTTDGNNNGEGDSAHSVTASLVSTLGLASIARFVM